MNINLSIAEIAELVSGRVEGDKNIRIHGLGRIEEALEGELTFLAQAKYEPSLYMTKASAVLVNEDFVPKEGLAITLIRVPDAYLAMASVMQEVSKKTNIHPRGIDPRAVIHETAQVKGAGYIGAGAIIEEGVVLGDNCQIYPNVYLGKGVTIGAETVIYPNVSIYSNCVVGASCTIHAGAVIGADGFGFAPSLDGYHKIPQLGNVIIEDQVEIGANACIDRATLGSTYIEQGVKIDNLVQVAHNCRVGKNTVIASQAGIAGSSRLGSWCQVGGQVGVAGHLTIGDRVQLGGQTGVLGDIEHDKAMLGAPAMEAGKAMRVYALMNQLPQLEKRISKLEQEGKEE